MSSILDYLVSSTRVMSEKVGMLGLCWRFVPSKDSNTTMDHEFKGEGLKSNPF